jgi:RNA polymerase sigma factor (TIGR02999 family)
MDDITRLLGLAARGDVDAENALYARVYEELRTLARHHLRGELATAQLDAAGLVSEAYLRMAGRQDLEFENRHRFFAYASRVMHSVIVDQVRERQAERRGGGATAITLTTSFEDDGLRGVDLLAVDQALTVLAQIDSRAHDVFEMHFFAGMVVEDICELKGLSAATVKRDLRKARAFVFQAIEQSAG